MCIYIYIYKYTGAMQFFDALHHQVKHLQPEMKELMQQQRMKFGMSPQYLMKLEIAKGWRLHQKACRKRFLKSLVFLDCVESFSWRSMLGGGPGEAQTEDDMPLEAACDEEHDDAGVLVAHAAGKCPVAGDPSLKQPKLARFFKPQEELKLSDLQYVTVQKATSRHVPVQHPTPTALQQQEAEAQLLTRKRSFGADGGGAGRLGGRPLLAVDDRRGVGNGVDRSNRLKKA